MTTAHVVWLALVAPLVGCGAIGLLGLAGERVPRRAVAWLACAAIGVSFLLGLVAFWRLHDLALASRSIHHTLYVWFSAGSFQADASILYDPLSAVMLLIVSGVGFLIHVYSVGYMDGDAEERRYFAYLNLFVFSMLVLVLAGNFVLLLAGWGMVGLSSYLLIGFWHQRRSAVEAAKKAFVMNAIGDVGLAIGIFLIFTKLGSVDYLTVFAHRSGLGNATSTMEWVCLLLLVGAVAKSAQLPLHTWLPDAMEGPTPVSALIHAATMVTAGVYLIARMNPLYQYAPIARHLIIVIGVAGLLMAGITALSQTDIKRIIAFSTMSQIAYMFVGVGLGAYWSGIFHLTTHAFFKALLFMGAGVVIHAANGEQDIRRLSGFRRALPRTFVCMWIGTLALAGVFPLSGSISKDAILAAGLASGGFWGWLAFLGGSVGAVLTGLYASRLMLVVFHRPATGAASDHEPDAAHHGEGPRSMMIPVLILAGLSVIGGVIEFPGVTSLLSDFLAPTTYGAAAMLQASTAQDWIATLIGTSAGLAGIGIAFRIWRADRTTPVAVPGPLRAVSEQRFFFDQAYHYAVYVPASQAASLLQRFVESPLLLAPIDATGTLATALGRAVARVQTGVVRVYALVFALGITGLVAYLMMQAA